MFLQATDLLNARIKIVVNMAKSQNLPPSPGPPKMTFFVIFKGYCSFLGGPWFFLVFPSMFLVVPWLFLVVFVVFLSFLLVLGFRHMSLNIKEIS